MYIYRNFFRTMVVVAALLAAVGLVQAQEVTIRYTLWEVSQVPAYEACAAAFEAENP